MSELETRRALFGRIPLGHWKRVDAGEVLFRSWDKRPFLLASDLDIGEQHVSSIRVGADGSSLNGRVKVLDISRDSIDGPRHEMTHMENRTIPTEDVRGGGDILTNIPFVRRQIRLVR